MLRDLDASRAGAAAGEIARLSQKPGKGKGGKYDVIFSPLAFAPLVSVAGGVASIFSVESGFSFFKDKVGKKVASSSVTLHDDGTLPGGYGSKPFDDEGVPTQRNTLIDKGTYKTHLYNTSYARKYKTRSTGNAGLISPDPWHLVLEPGKLSKENLFSQVKNGIYISNVWYTRFQNYQTGDFSTIPRDGMFIIKNGEFQKPIKQLRVSDNVLRLLQNVSAAANDSRQVWSWELGESGSPVTMPHILIKNVNLTEPTA
jgi:PmbA protein